MRKGIRMTAKAWLMIVTVAVIVAAGGVIGFWSLKVIQVRQEIAQEELRLAQLDTNRSAAADLDNQLRARAHDIDRLRVMVVNEDRLTEVIDTLEAEAERLGLDITVPSVQEPEEKTGQWSFVTMSIHVDGPPQVLLSYLRKVEYMPFLSGVTDWEMKVRREVARPGARTPLDGPPGSDSIATSQETEAQLQLELVINVME